MKKLWAYVQTSWPTVSLVAVASVVIVVTLTFRLGNLNHFHSVEVATLQHNPSFTSILHAPQDAPYYILRNVLHKTGVHTPLILSRGIAVALGLLVIVSFYGIMQQWYRPLVAGLASLSFALCNVILRVSRLGTPYVMLLLPLLLVWLWLLSEKTRYQKTALLVLTVAATGMLYVPGIAWLLVIAIVWRRKVIISAVRKQAVWFQISLLLLELMLLAPLAYGLLYSPHAIQVWLGAAPILSVREIWQTFIHIPATIAWHSQLGPLLVVGHAPLLDIFSLAMVIVGIYDSFVTWSLDRSKLALGLLVLGLVGILVGNLTAWVFILVPFYLLFAAGLSYLLEIWLAVFPRNPLARATAIVLLTVAVLLTAYYQMANYFVAWPSAPATKSTFSQHLE